MSKLFAWYYKYKCKQCGKQLFDVNQRFISRDNKRELCYACFMQQFSAQQQKQLQQDMKRLEYNVNAINTSIMPASLAYYVSIPIIIMLAIDNEFTVFNEGAQQLLRAQRDDIK